MIGWKQSRVVSHLVPAVQPNMVLRQSGSCLHTALHYTLPLNLFAGYFTEEKKSTQFSTCRGFMRNLARIDWVQF